MKIFGLALLLLTTALSLKASEYLVKCEDFPTASDVKLVGDELANDGVFLHFCNEKATTQADFILPKSGDYAIWVRTMSFGGNFRKVELFLNGKQIASLGDGTPENNRAGAFTWYHAPALLHLESGKLEVKMVSTSAYTRVDALLLTTDTAFLPQGKLNKIGALQKIAGPNQKEEK